MTCFLLLILDFLASKYNIMSISSPFSLSLPCPFPCLSLSFSLSVFLFPSCNCHKNSSPFVSGSLSLYCNEHNWKKKSKNLCKSRLWLAFINHIHPFMAFYLSPLLSFSLPHTLSRFLFSISFFIIIIPSKIEDIQHWHRQNLNIIIIIYY